MGRPKKDSVKVGNAVKAQSKTLINKDISSKDIPMFGDFSPYRDSLSAYEKAGKKQIPTFSMVKGLRDACNDWRASYCITVRDHYSTPYSETVSIEVTVTSSDGTRILKSCGISTQHAFSFAEGAKASLSERAQTIAIGKALSIFGLNFDGSLASADEMIAFQSMKDYDIAQDISFVANVVAGLSDNVKVTLNKRNINIRALLRLYDPKMSPKDLEGEILRFINA